MDVKEPVKELKSDFGEVNEKLMLEKMVKSNISKLECHQDVTVSHYGTDYLGVILVLRNNGIPIDELPILFSIIQTLRLRFEWSQRFSEATHFYFKRMRQL